MQPGGSGIAEGREPALLVCEGTAFSVVSGTSADPCDAGMAWAECSDQLLPLVTLPLVPDCTPAQILISPHLSAMAYNGFMSSLVVSLTTSLLMQPSEDSVLRATSCPVIDVGTLSLDWHI